MSLLRPDDVPARHVAARPDGLAGGGQSLTSRPSAITSRSRWRLVARRKKRDLAPMPGRKMVWIRSRTRDRRDRRRQNTGGKCKWAQPNQGTTAKAKGRRGDFSNFDGLVQQRIESALRCAPANSILWWLGGKLLLTILASSKESDSDFLDLNLPELTLCSESSSHPLQACLVSHPNIFHNYIHTQSCIPNV